MAIIAPGLSNKLTQTTTGQGGGSYLPIQPVKAKAPPSAGSAVDVIRCNLTEQLDMLIQVTEIENGYVVGISDERGSMPRLIYATDLTDVGQQITAFAVTRALGGKGAKT